MKRWAVLTVLLYALALLMLTLPVALVAFGNWGWKPNQFGLHQAVQVYSNWGYWLWLTVLVGGQFLLLLLPINLAERRLPARRPLKIPVIVTAFFLANLVFAGIFSILCAIFTDDSFYIFSFVDWILGPKTGGAGQPQQVVATGLGTFTSAFIIIGIFWLVWAVIFRNFAKTDEPDTLIKRATRWLLRGSILELLVAVPSHVIVRRRDDCCAPAGTFWGIATGISVMLLCFGPGVFFLFVERCRKLKPKTANMRMPTYDKSGLRRIYEAAKELFLRGERDEALDRFKSIYEVDCTFRDVANIVNDYYDLAKDKWIAKYEAQFRAESSKESTDDDGGDPGSAPVPAPTRPIAPLDASRTERHPNKDDRAI